MSDIDWASARKAATTTLEGEFPLVFTEATATKSSNDKPMIKAKLKVESGPFAGRTVFHNFTVSLESQFAMTLFFEAMDVLGMGEEFFARSPRPSMEEIAANLQGKRVVAELENKPFNGRDREQIKKFLSAVNAGAPSGLSGMTAAALPVATPAATPIAQPTSTEPPADPF